MQITSPELDVSILSAIKLPEVVTDGASAPVSAVSARQLRRLRRGLTLAEVVVHEAWDKQVGQVDAADELKSSLGLDELVNSGWEGRS